MTEGRWRRLLPQTFREMPVDLVTVTVLTLATVLVVSIPVLKSTPLRPVLGYVFILFIPGYAIVAALFPEASDRSLPESTHNSNQNDRASDIVLDSSGRIDILDRALISFTLSITIVSLVGIALSFTRFGVNLVPVLVPITLVTLFAAAVATVRRRELPETERFSIPYKEWYNRARIGLFSSISQFDRGLNVALAVSLVLVLGGMGYALAVPQNGQSYTELYILSENESSEPVAEYYPAHFTVGESKPVLVGIENHEHETTRYSIVVLLQNVRSTSAEQTETAIVWEQQITQFKFEIPDNETETESISLRPTRTGDNLRVALLLYRDTPPEDPSIETAYREVHFWTNVSDG